MSEYEGKEFIIPLSQIPGLNFGGHVGGGGHAPVAGYRYVPGQRVVLLDGGAYRDVTVIETELTMATVTPDTRSGKSESMYVAITQLSDVIAPRTSDPAMCSIFDAVNEHGAQVTPVRTSTIGVKVTVRRISDGAAITYGGLMDIDYAMLWGPEFTVTVERASNIGGE